MARVAVFSEYECVQSIAVCAVSRVERELLGKPPFAKSQGDVTAKSGN